jgi:spore coat polysaccharide biosynthesis protein SpsF
MVEGKKIGVIIQARYDSTRLPGKVLLPLPFSSNNSILSQIYNRSKLIDFIDDFIVATTDLATDDKINEEADKLGVKCFRGDENNVLKRYIDAAERFNIDIIIRVTGDNPLLFPEFYKRSIFECHVKENYEYSRNIGLPYGTSFEIVNFYALKKILNLNPTVSECEHVTLLMKNRPQYFKVQHVEHTFNTGIEDLRLTVDYPSDYAVLNFVLQHFEKSNYAYDFEAILDFFKKYPWVKEINKNNEQFFSQVAAIKNNSKNDK